MLRSQKPLLAVVLSLLFFQFGYSQTSTKPYELILKSGNLDLYENFSRVNFESSITAEELVNKRVYRLIQFNEIPDLNSRQHIAQLGIELVEYIPNKAYLASIPMELTQGRLLDLDIRGLYKIPVAWKKSIEVAALSFDSWAIQKDEILLNVNYYKDLKIDYVKTQIEKLGAKVIKAPDYISLLQVAIRKDQIEKLASLSWVSYVSQFAEPGTPEDDLGRALHRNNVLDSSYPTGRHYDGAGVSILVRDDGAIGPHIDFQGRTTQSGALGGTHGDGVAGIAGGAGNLNPRFKGAAKGTQVYVLNYQADFLDETLDLYTNDNVVLTNSSYSNGCNAGYTAITETVDAQINQNPSLLHIFSAGNSNNQDCDYGAGDQWGNITGGHKQGKNVIATANLNSDGSLVNSSSRGPAHDGRIKPDIAANGAAHMSTDPDNTYQSFGGTSGAAPAVMGTAAQLYQAYRELNGGVDPESSLIKATLLNTANDLGNPGPDYRYGWGHLNAFRAVKLLEDQRYLDDQVDQGGANTHIINIPDGTKQLRFMLYWLDQEGNVMTNKALINDLNMEVTDPTGVNLLPWILDPTPNVSTLDLPATTGVDNLNNMEQVLVDNPVSGDYTINVSGFEVPFGAVKYYIVQEVISENDISVIYPNGGEGFVPFETERIHWDAIGNEGEFLIETSVDGMQWDELTTVPGSVRMLNWSIQEEMTGTKEIRISRAGVTDKSDAPFSIGPVPENLEVLEACPDYIRLEWDEVVGATSYDVFILGDKYMEVAGNSTELMIDLPIVNPFDSNWFAVRARGPNDFVGRRSIAVNHDLGYFNCTIDNDLGVLEILDPSGSDLFSCDLISQEVKVLLRNYGQNEVTSFEAFYQLDNNPVVTETFTGSIPAESNQEFTFSMPFEITTAGNYDLKIWLDLDMDLAQFNDSIATNFDAEIITQSLALDLVEDFEMDVFPPTNWDFTNEDGSYAWEREEAVGADGLQTFAAYVHHYDYNSPGAEDVLFSYPIDLSNQVLPYVSFDYAYKPFSATLFDALRVDIFTDCGNTLATTIFEAAGDVLQTTTNGVGDFTPNEASDWVNISADLSAFIGQEIVLKFTTINGYGNNLWVDNINVFNFSDAPTAEFNLDASVCLDQETMIQNASGGFGNTYEWDFGPDANITSATGEGPFDISWNSTGFKDVKLTATNPNGSSELTQSIEVLENAIAGFTSSVNAGIVNFTNTSTFASDYFWEFGDGNTSIAENPLHVYQSNDVYTVRLTANSTDCQEDVTTSTLTIEVSDVNDLSTDFNLDIIPNPNQGDFNIRIKDAQNEKFELELFDLNGRSIKSWSLESVKHNHLIPVKDQSLEAGVYLLRASSSASMSTLRIVVQ